MKHRNQSRAGTANIDLSKVTSITFNSASKGAPLVFRNDSDSAAGKSREMESRSAFARVFKEILSMDSADFLKCSWNTHKFTDKIKSDLGGISISPADIYNFSQEMAEPGSFQGHLAQPLDKNDFKSRTDKFFGALVNICGKPCKISHHVTPGAYANVDIIQEVYVPRTKDVGCCAGQHPR